MPHDRAGIVRPQPPFRTVDGEAELRAPVLAEEGKEGIRCLFDSTGGNAGLRQREQTRDNLPLGRQAGKWLSYRGLDVRQDTFVAFLVHGSGPRKPRVAWW